MAKELAKTEEKLPAPIDDYGEYSGAGMESVDREEVRIPFIRVLQAQSPQVDPTKGGVIIEGAKAGMLCHMATEEIWPGDGSVEFVTCYREKNYVEWTPVDAGGGFVARYDWDDEFINELRAKQGRFGKLETPNGTEIAQTFYLYGILIPPDKLERRVVIGFSSTQIKKYQSVIDRVDAMKFINDGRQVQPPLFAWRWRIRSVPEKNKKGSWFGIRIEPAGATNLESLLRRNDPLFHRAKEFYDLLKAGHATADLSQMQSSAAETGEDIPFDDN